MARTANIHWKLVENYTLLPRRTIWRSPRHFKHVCPPRFGVKRKVSLGYPPLPSSVIFVSCPVLKLCPSSILFLFPLIDRHLGKKSVFNPPKSLSTTRHHGWGANSSWNFKGAQWLGNTNCHQSSRTRQDFVRFSRYVLILTCWICGRRWLFVGFSKNSLCIRS